MIHLVYRNRLEQRVENRDGLSLFSTLFSQKNIMNKILYSILFCFLFFATVVEAGNPDRQGEAGAYELLMNPWARSAGLHTMTTSMIMGVEALRLNPAG